jgi:hypothetical protein
VLTKEKLLIADGRQLSLLGESHPITAPRYASAAFSLFQLWMSLSEFEMLSLVNIQAGPERHYGPLSGFF